MNRLKRYSTLDENIISEIVSLIKQNKLPPEMKFLYPNEYDVAVERTAPKVELKM